MAAPFPMCRKGKGAFFAQGETSSASCEIISSRCKMKVITVEAGNVFSSFLLPSCLAEESSSDQGQSKQTTKGAAGLAPSQTNMGFQWGHHIHITSSSFEKLSSVPLTPKPQTTYVQLFVNPRNGPQENPPTPYLRLCRGPRLAGGSITYSRLLPQHDDTRVYVRENFLLPLSR